MSSVRAVTKNPSLLFSKGRDKTCLLMQLLCRQRGIKTWLSIFFTWLLRKERKPHGLNQVLELHHRPVRFPFVEILQVKHCRFSSFSHCLLYPHAIISLVWRIYIFVYNLLHNIAVCKIYLSNMHVYHCFFFLAILLFWLY